MAGYLLDANMSPRTAAYLRDEQRLDAVHVNEIGLFEASDKAIVAVARVQRRAVITFDLDYGELFHRMEDGRFGALVLRTSLQNWRAINEVLRRFFLTVSDHNELMTALVIIDDRRLRIVTEPRHLNRRSEIP